MQRQKLTVEKRKILGKKVNKLRKEGLLPANIYGKEIKSASVQVTYGEFEKVFKEVGETGLIDVQINGKAAPCLIHNVQYEPINRTFLHVDFYQVNLKEKVKTMVPIVTVGEAKAVIDKLGLLLQLLPTVEVEALPEDLPENIKVNVEKLAAVNDQITIGDIKTSQGVTILNDKSQVVVKIGELVSKEAQEQAAAEKAAAEAAKTAAAPQVPSEEGAKPESVEAPPAEKGVQPKAAEGKPAEQAKAAPPAPEVTKEAPKTKEKPQQ